MKKHYILFYLLFFLPFIGLAKEKALAPTVTLSTEAVAAATITPGGSSMAYILKVNSTEAFVLNNLSFKLSGTYANTDISLCTLYRSSSSTYPSPSLSFVQNAFSVGSGGVVSFTPGTSILANTPVYYFLIVQASANAVSGKTVKVIGGDTPNPVVLGSTASTLSIVNNQTDIAAGITILKPSLNLSTETVPSISAPAGTFGHLVYEMKIVTDLAININKINFKFSGTFLAGDLSFVNFELRNTPTTAGTILNSANTSASSLSNGVNNFINIFNGWNLSANSTYYLFVTVSPSSNAVGGRTVRLDGLNFPITLGSNTSFDTVNNQNDLGGTLTIIGPEITLSSETTATAIISQNTKGIAAVIKLLSTTGATYTGVNIPLEGTFTASDINSWEIFTSSSPAATSGAIISNSYSFTNGILTNNVAAPSNLILSANTPLYIILRPKFAFNAIAGRTLKVNGVTSPVTLNGFNGTVSNNQTDVSGQLTVTAPNITVTSLPLAAGNTTPNLGTTIYQFKLNTNETYNINQISLKIGGNFTAGQVVDLTMTQQNSSTPSTFNFSSKVPGDIATFNLITSSLVANTDKTYTITASFATNLPDGFFIKVDGSDNQFAVGSTEKTPTIINNQTDITGAKTVLANMPIINTTSSINDINTQPKVAYFNGGILAKISSPSPITGTTNCFVWPTGAIARGYVPRHYEINPPAASSEASATVTLYFTQADFDAFNAISSVDIPTGPADEQGKANLRLDKYSGPSTAGSNGLDYASDFPSQFINPDDNKIIWNTLASRWEITFDVTGFSGFFVGGTATPLPVNLISFSGKNIENNINLYWKTSSETNFSHFEIQKSADSKEFGTIGKVNGNSQSFYNFTDTNPVESNNYYRLKMVDLDGSSSFSKTIAVNYEKNGFYLSVENPAKNGELLVKSNYKNPAFCLLNSLGQKIETSVYLIAENAFSIKTKNIVNGMYFLNIQSDNKMVTRKVLME